MIEGLEDVMQRVAAHRDTGFFLAYANRHDEAEFEFRRSLNLLERRQGSECKGSRERREMIETYFARGESRLKGAHLVDEGVRDLVQGCKILPEFPRSSIGRIRDELVEARKRHYEALPEPLRKMVDDVLAETLEGPD